MAKIAYSDRVFTGALVLFAEEASGTSDALTKPAANNAAWKEIAHVEILKHNPKLFTEEFSKPDPDLGWIDDKDEFVMADVHDLTTRERNEIIERLAYGVAAAIVQGTAQAPYTQPNRRIRGWIKIQQRQVGAPAKDRTLMDIWCDIRLKEDPAAEKKTQVPVLELWKLKSTLNSIVLPAAA